MFLNEQKILRNTLTSFTQFGDTLTNGAFDIGSNNTPSAILGPLTAGGTYYIRIGNKFFEIQYSGFGAYGDMKFQYQVQSGTENMSLLYNNSGYDVDGPFTWTDYTITMKNDFGGDRASVSGTIYLNSEVHNNVGYTGIQLTREARTFPHTASGVDNQYISSYYRKWRHWQDLSTNINYTMSSASNYTLTATYARKYNVTYQNYFNPSDNGGTIKLNGNSGSSPSSLDIYEDLTYSLEAINQTRNSVSYTFDHWEFGGSSIGSSNPYSSYSPTGSGTLQARFNGKPVNTYRNMSFNDTHYGDAVQISWDKHPLDDSFVTQYAVWRKVKHNGVMGSATQIGTVTANGSSSYTYTDNEYLITNGYTDDLLYYDVRAYYSPSSAYSDADFVSVYGKESSIKMSTLSNQNNSVAKEKPTEFSFESYPNPFNPSTVIQYNLPSQGFVTIKIYDMLGREITTLVSGFKNAGSYNTEFSADKFNLSSGIYLYTLKAGAKQIVKKMIFAK